MNEKKTVKITIPILQQKISEMYDMLEKSTTQNSGLKNIIEEKERVISLQVQRISVLSEKEKAFDTVKEESEKMHQKYLEEHTLKRYLEGVVKGKDDMILGLQNVIGILTGKKNDSPS